MEHFTKKEEKNISLYFHISVLIKGLISLAEILVGTLALFIPLSYVTGLATKFAESELSEGALNFNLTNLFASHVISYVHGIPAISSTFLAVYLLSRGLIKVVLIYAMLKNKLSAYPISLIVLGLFVSYQMYQILISFSGTILALTIFDLIVMWFIWAEYKVLKWRMHAEHIK